jgi:hypothetical protein
MSKKQSSPVPSGSESIKVTIERRIEHRLIEIRHEIRQLRQQIRQQMFDEADSDADDTVPELGQKLLPFLLPRKLRDAVAGDLAQDFQSYVAKFGRTYAVRWYWWELGWLCVSRLSPTAIAGAIAFWLRRKIGF